MIDDLVTSKDKVEFLLKKFPELRDNDKKLWVAYLNIFHGLGEKLRNSQDPWVTFRHVLYDDDTAMPESIRRIRQKFQEAGLYVGEKREARLRESEEVRLWALSQDYRN